MHKQRHFVKNMIGWRKLGNFFRVFKGHLGGIKGHFGPKPPVRGQPSKIGGKVNSMRLSWWWWWRWWWRSWFITSITTFINTIPSLITFWKRGGRPSPHSDFWEIPWLAEIYFYTYLRREEGVPPRPLSQWHFNEVLIWRFRIRMRHNPLNVNPKSQFCKILEVLGDIASLRINLSLKTVQLSPHIFGHFCEN